MNFRYIQGDWKDFYEAPDEAMLLVADGMGRRYFTDIFPEPGGKYWSELTSHGVWGKAIKPDAFTLIAEREKLAEWDGEGLPPVGCRVEYTCKQPDLGHPAIEAGKWYGGTIIAYYDECVWTSDNGIRHLSNTIFRPMRSEEGKRRYAAIEALFEILDAGVSTSQDSIDIYDAIAAGKIPHIRID